MSLAAHRPSFFLGARAADPVVGVRDHSGELVHLACPAAPLRLAWCGRGFLQQVGGGDVPRQGNRHNDSQPKQQSLLVFGHTH
jgi:hypothetical protein